MLTADADAGTASRASTSRGSSDRRRTKRLPFGENRPGEPIGIPSYELKPGPRVALRDAFVARAERADTVEQDVGQALVAVDPQTAAVGVGAERIDPIVL